MFIGGIPVGKMIVHFGNRKVVVVISSPRCGFLWK